MENVIGERWLRWTDVENIIGERRLRWTDVLNVHPAAMTVEVVMGPWNDKTVCESHTLL